MDLELWDSTISAGPSSPCTPIGHKGKVPLSFQVQCTTTISQQKRKQPILTCLCIGLQITAYHFNSNKKVMLCQFCNLAMPFQERIARGIPYDIKNKTVSQLSRLNIEAQKTRLSLVYICNKGRRREKMYKIAHKSAVLFQNMSKFSVTVYPPLRPV